MNITAKIRPLGSGAEPHEITTDVTNCIACEAARFVKWTKPGEIWFCQVLEPKQHIHRVECINLEPLIVECLRIELEAALRELHQNGVKTCP